MSLSLWTQHFDIQVRAKILGSQKSPSWSVWVVKWGPGTLLLPHVIWAKIPMMSIPSEVWNILFETKPLIISRWPWVQGDIITPYASNSVTLFLYLYCSSNPKGMMWVSEDCTFYPHQWKKKQVILSTFCEKKISRNQ